MSSVMLQKCGGKLRPVAHFTSKLDAVAAGLPHCLKSVAVSSTLLEQRSSHPTPARMMHYHNVLLSLPNVTIIQSTVLNPATLLPTETNRELKDCLAAIAEVCSPQTDLTATPLQMLM